MPTGIELDIKVDVFENGKPSIYKLENDINGEYTFEKLVAFFKESLLRISLDVLKEEQSQGFDKKPVVFVDKKLNKPILNVEPFGTIEFRSRVQSLEIIDFAYREILKRSPVDTGRYESSHFVFLNGKRIATSLPELNAWVASRPQIKENDFIRIVNVTPYGRRLERLGVTRQRTRRVTVRRKRRGSRNPLQNSGAKSLRPNGAYFLATRSAKRKFKGNAAIYFGFIPGSQLGLSAAFSSGARSKSGKSRTYLYPTMKIYVGGKKGIRD